MQYHVVAQKNRYNISLPDHVSLELESRAKTVGASATEYAGDVIRWWFGQGCPPINKEEEEQRNRSKIDINKLDPIASYHLVGHALVNWLLEQLSVPDLFADAAHATYYDVTVAFDNHPTHWLVFDMFKDVEDEHDTLTFRAYPKTSYTRKTMRMELETERHGAKISFRQLPQ